MSPKWCYNTKISILTSSCKNLWKLCHSPFGKSDGILCNVCSSVVLLAFEFPTDIVVFDKCDGHSRIIDNNDLYELGIYKEASNMIFWNWFWRHSVDRFVLPIAQGVMSGWTEDDSGWWCFNNRGENWNKLPNICNMRFGNGDRSEWVMLQQLREWLAWDKLPNIHNMRFGNGDSRSEWCFKCRGDNWRSDDGWDVPWYWVTCCAHTEGIKVSWGDWSPVITNREAIVIAMNEISTEDMDQTFVSVGDSIVFGSIMWIWISQAVYIIIVDINQAIYVNKSIVDKGSLQWWPITVSKDNIKDVIECCPPLRLWKDHGLVVGQEFGWRTRAWLIGMWWSVQLLIWQELHHKCSMLWMEGYQQ